MSFLLKGDEVSFLLKRDGSELFCPRTHAVCHDPLGEVIRGCDIYIVAHKIKQAGISASDVEMRRLAFDYYGKDEPLCESSVAIPLEGWKYIEDVTAILYRRLGAYRNLYKHEYASPQPLYHQKRYNAYRVVHPDQCVVNYRGFVHP